MVPPRTVPRRLLRRVPGSVLRSVHNGCGTDAILGKFEDYEPFKECKRQLIARPEQAHVKEWGVCPSLRARPNMTAKKQAVAEAEQMAEQLRSEICRLRKENHAMKTWLDQVRKENEQLRAELSVSRSQKMTSGSKRKAAEIGADESEAEEAVEGETTIYYDESEDEDTAHDQSGAEEGVCNEEL